MSEIDRFRHKCIGIISCPSTYEVVKGRDHRLIPLYRIDDSSEEWKAKPGDLLVGGGGGESAALRISIPEALYCYTESDLDADEDLDDYAFHAYWSTNDAFIFCEGYAKLGWHPDIWIEDWLTEHVVAFILREYPEIYRQYCGPTTPELDGSICRLPQPGTIEERL